MLPLATIRKYIRDWLAAERERDVPTKIYKCQRATCAGCRQPQKKYSLSLLYPPLCPRCHKVHNGVESEVLREKKAETLSQKAAVRRRRRVGGCRDRTRDVGLRPPFPTHSRSEG